MSAIHIHYREVFLVSQIYRVNGELLTSRDRLKKILLTSIRTLYFSNVRPAFL